MLRRRPFFLLFPLLAASLLSCVDLPILEENTCGNGFIEAGEDCDHFGGKKTTEEGRSGAICNASGTANQCRLSCKSDDECAPYPLPATGSGWRCGVDSICRRPLGQAPFFQSVSTLIPGSVDDLFSGDFDGDGRKDVLAVGQSGFDVHYFTSDGDVATSTHISGAPMVPAIGKLTSSQADDFTVDVGQGIGVMLGRTGQTVEPTSYLSLELQKRYSGTVGANAPDDVRLVVVDTGDKNPMGDAQGPKPLALVNVKDSKGVVKTTLIDSAADPKLPQKVSLGGVTVDFQKLRWSIPVSFLGPAPLLGPHRQRFLLAAQNALSIFVIDPGGAGKAPEITLPNGFSVHGAAFFADVNADGFADVLVGTARCNGTCTADIDVAYGDGKGSFYAHSDLTLPNEASSYATVYPNGEMNPPPKDITEMEQYLPFAVGQLNVDPGLDFVNALGIYVSDSVANPSCTNTTNHYCRSARPSAGETWSEAQIGDFNANGHLDVAATSQGSRGIDFFNGLGTGVFNTFSIPTEGIATHLAVGDFDGDLLTDLAFDSVTPRGQEENHTLFVSFGGTTGAPAPPLSMGEVPHLLQIVAGNITSLGNDAAADIVLLAGSPGAVDAYGKPNPDWKVGLSLGNGTRQLQAPLVFFATGSIRIEGLPMASAIGLFNGNGTPPPPAVRPLHTDVAALIASFKDVMPAGGTGEPPAPLCLFNAALWVLPATGEAAIDPPTDDSKNTRTGMTASDAVLGNFLPLRRFVETVPINLHNRTGADDLLITYPTYDTCENDPQKMLIHGALYRAHFDEAQRGQPHLTLINKSLGDNQFLRRVRVGDVDGDGFLDIVALQEKFVLDMGGQTQSAQVVVLRGDGNGSFGAPLPLPMGEIPSPSDIALVNTDGDSNPEIVVLARNADGLTGELFLIDWIKDATAPRPAVALQITDAARKTTSVVLDQPSALVGGDFDGDGVDDVAVAVTGGIQMLKGVAK
jgi:hypothetical protein